ncbi:MAG: FkbM family methyltransferase [Chitinophagia bacterium]|nr:FkbM family methyltransferase [Chitinophagia bacterium]
MVSGMSHAFTAYDATDGQTLNQKRPYNMRNLKDRIKSMLRPDTRLYAFLSFLRNYPRNRYLPREILGVDGVLTAFSKDNPEAVFIQVGSNDGISGDPLHEIVVNARWTGVMVEPVPFLFEQLRANYRGQTDRISFSNTAIGQADGSRKTLFVIDSKHKGKVPDWYFQLNTFERNVLYHHDIPNIDDYISEIEVDVVSLDELLLRYRIESLDLLHIDTEGFDFEVLKTLDLTKTKPHIILIEYKHLTEETRIQLLGHLRLNGYKALRCRNDILAMDRETSRRYMAHVRFRKLF